MTAWSFACPDWESRLRQGRSLVPDLPLDEADADRAVRVFNKLRLPDVPDQPPMAEAAGEWFRDIVRALFGSVDEMGVRRVGEVFTLVPKKSSKALALDTAIATPGGFTTMGVVQVGDLVLAADGRPTRVLEKSPVFIGRPCYEVEFSTGERVICDAEHLWVTDAHRDRERQPRHQRRQPAPRVKTTEEIAGSLTVKSGRLTINNHRTALCGPLDLPDADLPIPPYALGMWLGNGATAEAIVTTACEDADAVAERLTACGQPAYVRAVYADRGSATIALTTDGEPPSRRLPYRFRTEAGRLGLLGRKHIPQLYLRASRHQRLELLRGLMDSDGHVTTRGHAVYTTVLPGLRDDVIELVASLGLKPTVSSSVPRIGEREYRRAWRVCFTPFDDTAVSTFARKADRQKRAPNKAARSRSRQIVAVRRVPSVPVQCIGVESETKQFLVTRSLIPTHNTTGGAGIMLTAMILNRRPRAEFLLVGPTQEIADLAFQQAAGMIAADTEGFLQKRFDAKDHIKTIVDRTNGSTLKIKTFDMKVMTGAKPTGVLVDELHVMSSMSYAARVIGQVRGGLLPRPDGFLIFITTQSDEPPAGVFKSELQLARGIRDGRIRGEAASMLPILYEFPEAMQVDPERPWEDPKVWPMVLPNLGLSITIEKLRKDFAQAKEKGEEEIRRWASQHLNVEIGLALHANRWAGADYWEARGDAELTLERLVQECEVIVAGVDGGGLDDLLSLAFVGRHARTRRWMHWQHSWAHQGVLERRKSEASRLHDFAAAGDLTIVPDMGLAFADLASRCADVYATGRLAQVGLDPAGVGLIVEAIAEAGMPAENPFLVGVSQGWQLQGAVKTAEVKVASGDLVHGARPIMAWAVGNAKTEQRGNALMITKQAAGTAKIDPLMALFDAVALMSKNPEVTSSSYLETAEMVIV